MVVSGGHTVQQGKEGIAVLAGQGIHLQGKYLPQFQERPADFFKGFANQFVAEQRTAMQLTARQHSQQPQHDAQDLEKPLEVIEQWVARNHGLGCGGT